MTKIIRNIFGKKSEKPELIQDETTVPINADRVETEFAVKEKSFDYPDMCVGFGQSIGKVRDHNEDALFTLTSTLSGHQEYLPLGLYMVADGMGGHDYGELASVLAIRTIVSQVLERIFLALLSPQPSQPSESIQEIMQNSVQEAHRVILKEAPGSGTTITSVLIFDQKMTIAHAGDSRAYHIDSQGETKILTRDHSLVERMIELGQLTVEEAAVHPQRNVLYRALGQNEQFVADISTSTLPTTGHILICSDGLWGVVPEEEIVSIVHHSTNPQTACQLLINAANSAGGPDNITAVLIKLPVLD